jgi:multidrug transporter EmrE-like cation transporter
MSLKQLVLLSIVEVIGDFSYKQFANHGGVMPFLSGSLSYIGVVYMLIVSLQNSTLLMVNAGWDGISGILESICAYIFLGERFTYVSQYFGILFIMFGLYLLKIPTNKKSTFVFPHFFLGTQKKLKTNL